MAHLNVSKRAANNFMIYIYICHINVYMISCYIYICVCDILLILRYLIYCNISTRNNSKNDIVVQALSVVQAAQATCIDIYIYAQKFDEGVYGTFLNYTAPRFLLASYLRFFGARVIPKLFCMTYIYIYIHIYIYYIGTYI